MKNKEIYKEYAKCLKDYIYAIETFMKVYTQDEGRKPFKLFEQQKRAIKQFHDDRFILGHKSRQVGFTTIMCVYAAYLAVFARKNKPENIIIICNHLETAIKLVKTIKEFIEMYPPQFVDGYKDNYTSQNDKMTAHYKNSSIKKIELLNGSKVQARACKSGIRSESTTLIIFDEAAFFEHPDPEELMKGVYMTMSASNTAKCIMSSTPNGLDPIYYTEYKDAKEGGKYKIATMRWECDPRYNKDLKWQKFDEDGELIEEFDNDNFDIDHILEMIDKGYEGWSTWFEYQSQYVLKGKVRSINSELKLKFVGSAGNIIAPKTLKKIEANTIEPIAKEGIDENIWIWNRAEVGKKYLLAADVGRGDGGDYSTFYILDAETLDMCVEFRAVIDEPSFALIINEYGLKYNALVVVEVTGGYGGTVINDLERMDYPNLYYEKTSQDPFSNTETVEMVEKDEGGRCGFIITDKNRSTITTKVQNLIDKFLFNVKSVRLYNELVTWIWAKKGNKVRADHQRSSHDDLIMALGVGLYVIEYVLKNIEENKKKDEATLNAMVNVNNKGNDKNVRLAPVHQKPRVSQDPLYFDPNRSFNDPSAYDIPEIIHANIAPRYRFIEQLKNDPVLREQMRKIIAKKGIKGLIR